LVGISIVIASGVMATTSGQQPLQRAGTIVAITTAPDDSPAAMLSEALRDQLRRSARYQLADKASDAHIVVHVVGLAIPSCRPSNAIAVSYVGLPTEKHLGTAVLTTDQSRVATSARDVLNKLPQMLQAPR
jgi:ethanolamine utilization microcompartment shell protein EutL